MGETLRDRAIAAMYRADGERVGERVFVEKALDGLLGFLHENYSMLYDSIPTTPPWDGVLLSDVLDLLAYGGEEQ